MEISTLTVRICDNPYSFLLNGTTSGQIPDSELFNVFIMLGGPRAADNVVGTSLCKSKPSRIRRNAAQMKYLYDPTFLCLVCPLGLLSQGYRL